MADRPMWARDDRAYRAGGTGPFAGRGPRSYRRSDERIHDEINARLTTHPDVDATDIEVRVENGIATLTGRVDDRHQKRVAELIAEDVAGVDDVMNRIGVRHGIWSHDGGGHPGEHGG